MRPRGALARALGYLEAGGRRGGQPSAPQGRGHLLLPVTRKEGDKGKASTGKSPIMAALRAEVLSWPPLLFISFLPLFFLPPRRVHLNLPLAWELGAVFNRDNGNAAWCLRSCASQQILTQIVPPPGTTKKNTHTQRPLCQCISSSVLLSISLCR